MPRTPPFAAAAMLACSFIGACAVQGPKVDPAYLANTREDPTGIQTEVAGDWDDLNAALAIGLGKLNLAVVDSAEPSPGASVRLSLVDVLDRPAWLLVERLDQGQPARIRVSAAFSRRRDPAREKLLVAAVAQRFGELRGVEIAPVR